MHLTALHHVELCVANGKKVTSYFTDKLSYSLRAKRENLFSQQWVVGSQKSLFVITQRKTNRGNCSQSFPFTSFCCGDSHQIDSVFNVALEVKNLESVTARMQKLGGTLHQPVTQVEDESGVVRYSIVGSCCGNVVHTLLDKSQYKGQFLPTFIPSDCLSRNEEPITHCDHLTYVCYPGESESIIAWYKDCLGMRKFKTNPKEDLTEGLVIRDGVGMRLRVMDYWPCAESGVYHPNPDGLDETSLKIVIAESLPDKNNTHLAAFLDGHGGPGLQHIGLHTPSIARCVEAMARNLVPFRKPPAAYYRNERKKCEIQEAGFDVQEFKKLGILIDSEADTENGGNYNHYLLQIFALPLFDEETFFLEVVQRLGARGFGAGNVTALAKSIEEERLYQLKQGQISISQSLTELKCQTDS